MHIYVYILIQLCQVRLMFFKNLVIYHIKRKKSYDHLNKYRKTFDGFNILHG